MMKSKFFFLLLAFSSLSFLFAKEDLSELHIYNRVMLLVKEEYVQPERLDPKKMLIGALDAVQRQVPELVVREFPNEVEIELTSSSQRFQTKNLTSLWDLSFSLRDIFRFMQPRLPRSADVKKIEYAAINGTLSQLDPHSNFMEPKSSKEMKLSTKGEFGGLGIVIGLREGVLTVISPLDGSPADKAGIKALDQ
ncbi:MAG: hypothetical protein WCK49_03835, partial [Myxococcaceae bacterium]